MLCITTGTMGPNLVVPMARVFEIDFPLCCTFFSTIPIVLSHCFGSVDECLNDENRVLSQITNQKKDIWFREQFIMHCGNSRVLNGIEMTGYREHIYNWF